MTTGELAAILGKSYHTAPKGYAVARIHLFGIEFATELDGHPLKEVCAQADLPVSFATEIRKGMRLAEFVEIKK